MTDLTEAQLLVLQSACDNDFGLASRPPKLNRASVAKMTSALTERGFAKEVLNKAGAPAWREQDGREYALKILKAGRDALAASTAVKAASEPQEAAPQVSGASASIKGPKASLIVGLMRRKEGASPQTLIKATGWLPHTTRAALSGIRKKGIVIERSVEEQSGGSIYRILDTAPLAKTA